MLFIARDRRHGDLMKQMMTLHRFNGLRRLRPKMQRVLQGHKRIGRVVHRSCVSYRLCNRCVLRLQTTFIEFEPEVTNRAIHTTESDASAWFGIECTLSYLSHAFGELNSWRRLRSSNELLIARPRTSLSIFLERNASQLRSTVLIRRSLADNKLTQNFP